MRIPTAATLATVAIAAMLGACTPAKAPAEKEAPAAAADPTGFSHPSGADLFGYYTAKSDVSVGTWKLVVFHLGGADDFAKWESNERMTTYAPVMLEFENTASPMQTNELGAQFHSESERILPSAYAIAADGKIDFVGTGAKLGKVTFHGKLDMERINALSGANASPNPPPADAEPDATVMSGTLTVGDKTFENLAFTWFGGD